MNQTIQPSEQTTMGHPKGLFYLFFAELWERFSFYGMRAILVLYLVSDLFQNLADKKEVAFEIYAAYGALVYFTPAIGGMIADRLIGHKNSILLGALLMCIGHFVMAFPSEYMFYTALGLLIIGNGFFKPNISSMVGGLYKQGDERRDAGFTIFYMGINIGAAAAPLACGFLGEYFGWHWGFGLAGIGMAVGMFYFWRGTQIRIYGEQGEQPVEWQNKKVLGTNVRNIVWTLAFLSVPLFAFLVNQNSTIVPGIGMPLMSLLLHILLGLVVVYVIYLMATKLSSIESQRLFVIMVLTFFVTVFWAFFEQAGSSLTLFAEEQVNLSLINAAMTNSINPIYIILLAIPFSWMWRWLAKRKLNPITPVKFSLGIFQLGIGFFIFAWSMNSMDFAGKVPMMYLLLGYLLLTTGELFVSPIGLSKVTELSPALLVSFMMGVWFLSSAFAHHIAGTIAKLTVTKETKEYVEKDGFMDGIAGFITGADQNAMGKFTFDFNAAYNDLTDTVIHDKTVNFKNKKTEETYTIQAATLADISDSIAKVNDGLDKGKYKPVDTTYTLVASKVVYPSIEEFDAFSENIEKMKPVNKKWSEAADMHRVSFDSLKSNYEGIQRFNSMEQKLAFYRYMNGYYKTLQDSEVRTVINSRVDKDLLDAMEYADRYDKDLKKIQKTYPEKFDQADDYLAKKAALEDIDPEFAEHAYVLVEGFDAQQKKIRSHINLGTYTNVFTMIGVISVFFAAIALIISPILRYMMHGIH